MTTPAKNSFLRGEGGRVLPFCSDSECILLLCRFSASRTSLCQHSSAVSPGEMRFGFLRREMTDLKVEKALE